MDYGSLGESVASGVVVVEEVKEGQFHSTNCCSDECENFRLENVVLVTRIDFLE